MGVGRRQEPNQGRLIDGTLGRRHVGNDCGQPESIEPPRTCIRPIESSPHESLGKRVARLRVANRGIDFGGSGRIFREEAERLRPKRGESERGSSVAYRAHST